MTWSEEIVNRVGGGFETDSMTSLLSGAFTTGLISSSPLMALPPDFPAREGHSKLLENEFDAAPVDDGGSYYRYVLVEWLDADGIISDLAKPITAHDQVPHHAPMFELLRRFVDQHILFVLKDEDVQAITTRADIQRPAMSMFAFGCILALEERFKSMISLHSKWQSVVSPERLQKLNEVHNARKRDNVQTTLIEALNLDDEIELIRKLGLEGSFGFKTKTSFNDWAKVTKRLRNVLAHGGGVLDKIPEPTAAIAEILKLYELATKPS